MILSLKVIRGGGVSDGYIEVRPAGVSKGLFLEHVVNNLKSIKHECDFVLAIGDDATGEISYLFNQPLEDVNTLSIPQMSPCLRW